LAEASLAGAVDWIRPGLSTNQPVWGIRGGLLWAVAPAGFRPGEPRGLIRLGYPVLPQGRYDLINFIATEPIVKGRRGFSELESSRLDGVPGKRIWGQGELDGKAAACTMNLLIIADDESVPDKSRPGRSPVPAQAWSQVRGGGEGVRALRRHQGGEPAGTFAHGCLWVWPYSLLVTGLVQARADRYGRCSRYRDVPTPAAHPHAGMLSTRLSPRI